MEALLNKLIKSIEEKGVFINRSINDRRLIIDDIVEQVKPLIKVFSRNIELQYKLNDYLIKNRMSFIVIKALQTSEHSYIGDIYEYIINRLDEEKKQLSDDDFIKPSYEKTWLIIDLLLSYYYMSKRENDNINSINHNQPSRQMHDLIQRFNFAENKVFLFIIRNIYSQIETESEYDVIYLLEDVLMSGCSQFVTSFTYLISTEDMSKKQHIDQKENYLDSDDFGEHDRQEDYEEQDKQDDDDEDPYDIDDDIYNPELDFYEENRNNGEYPKKHDVILRTMKLLYEKEYWEALEILQQYIGGMNAVYEAVGMNRDEFCKFLSKKNTMDSLHFEYKIRKKALEKEIENKEAVIEFTRKHRMEFLAIQDGKWVLIDNNNTKCWMVLYLLIKEQILRCIRNPQEELDEEIKSVFKDLPPIDFVKLEKPGRPPKMIANLFNVLMKQERFKDVETLIDSMGVNNIFLYDEKLTKPYFGVYGHTTITSDSRMILRDKLLPAFRNKPESAVKLYMNTHLKCFVQLLCFLSWYFSYYENAGDPMCLQCTKRGLDAECKKFDRVDGIQIKRNHPINNYKIFGEIESINNENKSLTIIASNIRWTRFYFACSNDVNVISKYFDCLQEGMMVRLHLKRYRFDTKNLEMYDLAIVDEDLQKRIIDKEKNKYIGMDKVLNNIIDSKTLMPYEDELDEIQLFGSEQVYVDENLELQPYHENINNKIKDTFHILCQYEPTSIKKYVELVQNNNIWGYFNPNTKDRHKTSINNVNKYNLEAKEDLELLMAAGYSNLDLVHIYMNSYLKVSITIGYFINRIISLDTSVHGKCDISELFKDYRFYGIAKKDYGKSRIKLLIKNVYIYNSKGDLEDKPNIIPTEQLLKSKYSFKLVSWHWNMKNYSLLVSDFRFT